MTNCLIFTSDFAFGLFLIMYFFLPTVLPCIMLMNKDVTYKGMWTVVRHIIWKRDRTRGWRGYIYADVRFVRSNFVNLYFYRGTFSPWWIVTCAFSCPTCCACSVSMTQSLPSNRVSLFFLNSLNISWLYFLQIEYLIIWLNFKHMKK